MKMRWARVSQLAVFAISVLSGHTLGAAIISFSTVGSCFADVPHDSQCLTPFDTVRLAANDSGDVVSLTWTSTQGSVEFGQDRLSNVGLGSFQLAYLPSQPDDTAPVLFTPLTLLLSINESSNADVLHIVVPIEITGAGGDTGLVGPGSSDLQATFDPGFLDGIANTTPPIFSPFQLLSAPSTNLGQTNLQLQLIEVFGSTSPGSQAAPEPLTPVLLGTGLAALAWVRRQRLRAKEVLVRSSAEPDQLNGKHVTGRQGQ